MSPRTYNRTLKKPQRAALAQRCGCSLLHWNFVMYGHKQASLELACAVEVATDGVVRAESLRPDLAELLGAIRAAAPAGVPLPAGQSLTQAGAASVR